MIFKFDSDIMYAVVNPKPACRMVGIIVMMMMIMQKDLFLVCSMNQIKEIESFSPEHWPLHCAGQRSLGILI